MDRLDRYEELMTHILIGAAIVFLVAMPFAPETEWHLEDASLEVRIQWYILWFSLLVFSVKLIHEQSVWAFRIHEALPGAQLRYVGELPEVLMLLSRTLVVGALAFAISGMLGRFFTPDAEARLWQQACAVALLIFIFYSLPDVILSRQVLDHWAGDQMDIAKVPEHLRSAVACWLNLDFVNVVLLTSIITGATEPDYWASFVFIPCLLIIGLLHFAQKSSSGKACWLQRWVFQPTALSQKGSPNLARKTRIFIWIIGGLSLLSLLTHDLSFLSPLAHDLGFLSPLIQRGLRWSELLKAWLPHLLIPALLGINIADWVLNRKFYFGK